MEHHTITRLDECEFIVRPHHQAGRGLTQQPAALILSPLLTGGKVPCRRGEGVRRPTMPDAPDTAAGATTPSACTAST